MPSPTATETAATGTAQPTAGLRRWGGRLWRTDLPIHLSSGALTAALLTLMMRLWRADLSTPFYYSGDAVASAEYFKNVLQNGWYETQPALGAPYGQHYHDFPFSDDLNPAMAKLLGIFTSNWAVAFNLYYLLGFILCAFGAVWFLRVCGLSPWMTVALATLYALAPYHFIRNENHLFLSSYFCVPLAMVVVLRAARGEPLWGRRSGVGKFVSMLTGRGAGTVLILALVTYSGAYYGLFTALLLAPIGLLCLIRTRDRRRFFGVIAACAVVVIAFIGAMLPDIIYQVLTGGDHASLTRTPIAAEVYAFKFASLVMPAPGHPLAFLAKARLLYDDHYPLPSEEPALGLMAAIGFVLLLSMAFLALTGGISGKNLTPAQLTRRLTGMNLSVLTWIAFAFGTVGGLGTIMSFLTSSIRGWNRLSIFIALFALAGLGLVLEGLAERLAARRTVAGGGGNGPRRLAVPVFAVVVLLLGAADQSIAGAVPAYRSNQVTFASDGNFVARLQTRLPAGSMIFQLPYQAFPESEVSNRLSESDQLKLFLHSTSLRWSGGGIKGRPLSDWPADVANQTPAEMTRNLAAIGFVGIVIRRQALADHGRALESSLLPILGKPSLISEDGQYSFLSLTPADTALKATTTQAQRTAIATAITHIAP